MLEEGDPVGPNVSPVCVGEVDEGVSDGGSAGSDGKVVGTDQTGASEGPLEEGRPVGSCDGTVELGGRDGDSLGKLVNGDRVGLNDSPNVLGPVLDGPAVGSCDGAVALGDRDGD